MRVKFLTFSMLRFQWVFCRSRFEAELVFDVKWAGGLFLSFRQKFARNPEMQQDKHFLWSPCTLLPSPLTTCLDLTLGQIQSRRYLYSPGSEMRQLKYFRSKFE